MPEEKNKLLKQACQKFLSLPQQERITKIILELRRLLLLPENISRDSDNLQEINKAIQKEPDYLKPILKNLILNKKEQNNIPTKSRIPKHIIITSFLG